MATVLMSALRRDWAESLRRTPPLVNDMRRWIRSGDVGPAVDFGKIDEGRRGKLEQAFGAKAWPAVQRVVDGEVGDTVRHDARILTPDQVGSLARALGAASVSPAARKGSAEALAHRFRALVSEIEARGVEMLVIGTTIAERRAAIVRGYAIAEAQGIPRLRVDVEKKPTLASLLARGMNKNDAKVLREMLHVGGALRSESPEKNKEAYEALRAIFFDREGLPRRFVAGEIPTLWSIVITPTYSKRSRGLAALLGAHAMKNLHFDDLSGDACNAAKRLLHEVGPKFFSQVLDDLDFPGRLALSVWAAVAHFARYQVLKRWPNTRPFTMNWAFSADRRAIRELLEESERDLLVLS